MRILAPYCTLNTRVVRALEWYADDVEFVYTGRSRTAYWEAIAERWQGSEDLMIVEQDIEINEEVVAEFVNCPEPWCVYWYTGPPCLNAHSGVKLKESLGCTKFSAGLQYALPHEKISPFPEQQSWDIIDGRITKMAMFSGFTPHIHGQVRHFHQFEVTLLPSPSNKWRPYVWKNLAKGAYPSAPDQGVRVSEGDPDKIIIDGSVLENEV